MYLYTQPHTEGPCCSHVKYWHRCNEEGLYSDAQAQPWHVGDFCSTREEALWWPSCEAYSMSTLRIPCLFETSCGFVARWLIPARRNTVEPRSVVPRTIALLTVG